MNRMDVPEQIVNRLLNACHNIAPGDSDIYRRGDPTWSPLKASDFFLNEQFVRQGRIYGWQQALSFPGRLILSNFRQSQKRVAMHLSGTDPYGPFIKIIGAFFLGRSFSHRELRPKAHFSPPTDLTDPYCRPADSGLRHSCQTPDGGPKR